ncbi:ABC-2 type transport system permease protein [Streptomyces sp. DconLS]|uniref:ABC transporter permease n=1 Tax=Streptomyces TaxID=1883 RepID=UPI00081F743A|nr:MULTISPECIES: ABC transporter permease [unclassified Streptomyces]SCF58742.1 ABC-2 type transport system permease protein [Streptomyces sp. LamerLS-31b]SCG02268.1 ABC-2 type transport system permease protein [Streptomyces sp. DconLS]
MTEAITNGMRRGAMELRHLARSSKDLSSYLFNVVVFVLVANWRHQQAQLIVAGGIASLAVLTALTSLPQALASDKTDGTLLRVRGLPRGLLAYVTGKILFITCVAFTSSLLLLFLGAGINNSGLPGTVTAWLTLIWVLVAGFAATAPLGLLIGAVLPNAREALAVVMFPVCGLLAISGVFFPLSQLPGWLQAVAEAFPLKWMAQGAREALTTSGNSGWQLPALGVFLAWAVLGSPLAAWLLQRTTRRESGSALARRRELSIDPMK